MKNPALRVDRVPRGLPSAKDFTLVDAPMPVAGEGEVVFRADYMSLDPAIRRYLPVDPGAPEPLGGSAKVGEVAIAGPRPPASGYAGGLIGRVIESRHPEFAVGDLVQGGSLMQRVQAVPGGSLVRLAPDADPTDELGLFGQPGFVAWLGMTRIGRPQRGETVVVSAAGGAVGMVAGQIARRVGARVIGIASGDKVRHVVHELGFDACIDRGSGDVAGQLDRLAPDGVDVHFDNVGGAVGRMVFDRMRPFGRVVVCGMASEYNATEADVGPPWRPILRKRLRVEGFVVYDHYDLFEAFRADLRAMQNQGALSYRCEIVDGLGAAPDALGRLLAGQNKGKMIVRFGDDT